MEIDYPEDGLNRVTTAFRLILTIPIAVILVLGKYPRWWFDWNLELSRFEGRLFTYLALLRDEYPSTDDQDLSNIKDVMLHSLDDTTDSPTRAGPAAA